MNLYPLPLNGFGGQQTQTVVANQLHDEICSHKITIAQAARTLEGDWLSKGLPNNDYVAGELATHAAQAATQPSQKAIQSYYGGSRWRLLSG